MTINQFMREKPGTSFLIFVVFLLLVMAIAPRLARAQTWHGYEVRQGPPDCNLARMSSDNYIADGKAGTITARRYQLQMISIGTAVLASYAVHKVFHTGTVKSAAIGGVGVGVIPHVRSVLVQRRYPIDPGDMLGDAAQRMIPFMIAEGHSEHSFKGHARAFFQVAATYAATMCWVHP